MNDPHVVALLYRVKHGKSHDYSKAEPLVCNEPAFRLEVKDKQVRFELKEHFATENEARRVVEDYIRNWEFNACLKGGDGCFKLEFNEPEIIDRSPTPGVKEVYADFRFMVDIGKPEVTVGHSEYPSPPSGVNFNDPDVQTMYHRYMGYRQGNEPLAGMAYFCLTILDDMSGQGKNRRKAAAKKYHIQYAVLKRIGELCNNKGGQRGARKSDGVGKDFTTEEHTFLERAIMKIIRRVAEKAADPEDGLPEITISTLSQK